MDNYTNSGSLGRIRSAFTYRKEAPRSLFRVHTWGGSVEGVTFTCEPQLAVVPLVLQQLSEFREHLPAVAADQYIWIAYDIPPIKPVPPLLPLHSAPPPPPPPRPSLVAREGPLRDSVTGK